MAPSNVIDNNPSTRWGACINGCEGTSWIAVNLGASFNLREILIDWEYAHAVDFHVEACESDVCHEVYREYGKSSEADTRIDVSNTASAQGISQVKVYMTRRRDGMAGFSIFSINSYRQYEAIS